MLRTKLSSASMSVAKNDVSSAASVDPSDTMFDPETVEDDDWVIVKKRKITILVPAAPPVCLKTENQEANCIPSKPRRTVRRSSRAMKRKQRRTLTGRISKPAATSVDDDQIDEVRSIAEEIHHDHAASPGNETQTDGSNYRNEKPILQHKQLANAGSDENVAASCRKRNLGLMEAVGTTQMLSIGAPSVVNIRLRALNLERELQRQGGLKLWLASQGLSLFSSVLERERLGKYQLANLTMSKLKEMGTAAVGPRRKLIHAIDRLCQPYFNDPWQQ